MLRTLFFYAVVIWMLGLMLQFGGSVRHILLVGAIMLVMKYTLRRRFLYWHR